MVLLRCPHAAATAARYSRGCKAGGTQDAPAAVRRYVCCRRLRCRVSVEHTRPVQNLCDDPALALAQRPADVHTHGVTHIALVGLVVCLFVVGWGERMGHV